MRTIFALIISTLTICVMISAVSATDYSQLEAICETTLSDPAHNLGILAPVVHISTAEVTINYIGLSTTTTAICGDLGGMLGAYWAIVNKYPEAGDLLITDEDIYGNAVATFRCSNEWVSGLDYTDTSAAERLVLKVIMTAKSV